MEFERGVNNVHNKELRYQREEIEPMEEPKTLKGKIKQYAKKVLLHIKKILIFPCKISYHTYLTLAFLYLSLSLFITMVLLVFLMTVDEHIVQIIYIVTILASTGILTTIGSLVNKLKRQEGEMYIEEIV